MTSLTTSETAAGTSKFSSKNIEEKKETVDSGWRV